jgi:hypothetical protein
MISSMKYLWQSLGRSEICQAQPEGGKYTVLFYQLSKWTCEL